MNPSFTGTTILIRLALRRDRRRLTLWILGIAGTCAAIAAAVQGTYSTPTKVSTYAAAGDSAATRVTSGRQVALDMIEGITANEITMFASVGITLMVVFSVIRHTRAEEESGVAELLRAGAVGRHASQLAALVVSVGAAFLTSVLLTLTLVGFGLDTAGSAAFGSGMLALGLLFAGVATAAAQVTVASRGALALAGGVLGALYAVRGVGAVAENWVYWLSPFGWAQGVNAYGDERWWLLGILLASAAACFGLAVWLTARRDAGAGLFSARPGRPRSSESLSRTWGLALRMQRGLLIGWLVGIASLAAIYGSILPEVPDLFAGNDDLLRAMGIGQGSDAQLIAAFLSYVNLTLGVVGAVFVAASVLRLRAEEETGRLESLLSTRLTRLRWIAGSLVISGLGALLVAVAMGGGLLLGYLPVATEETETIRIGELVLGAFAELPAMLMVAALVFLVVAWLPRLTALAWAVVGWLVVEAFLGDTLKLPDGIRAASPFFHLPNYPSDAWTAGPTLVLLALTGVAVALGCAGYRRRDVG